MTETDLPYFQHMLDAVERLHRYLDGVDQDEFEENEVLQDAVIRQLEILGEAAWARIAAAPSLTFLGRR